jgi:hypothetical protein
MGNHVPSSDQWFTRYASPKFDKCCWNSAPKGLGVWLFQILTKIRNETLETLNMKHVYILLDFPKNICVPYADKPSNGYGIWEIARGKIFSEI